MAAAAFGRQLYAVDRGTKEGSQYGRQEMHERRAWANRMGQQLLQWTWSLKGGQVSDLFTQNYKITKKLTFNLHFKSTKKNIPKLRLG